jgi:hypothetical protein
VAHDVFISYSSPDRNAALAVLHGLERAGIRCWMAPRDIKPGAIWAQAIMEGIAGAQVVVVVFSANANRSANVINEVDAAVRKSALIVPFRIEDVMPDGAMEYHLRTRHWLDALTPDLEAHTARLAEQVQQLLAGPPEVRPDPPSGHREKPADLPKPAPKTTVPVSGRRWDVRRFGVLAALVLVAAVAAYLSLMRNRPVRGVEFVVREVSSGGGNETTLRLTSQGLRFFEAGSTIPQLAQRQYDTRFASGATRYVNIEVKLTYEAPGREIAVPLACDVFTDAGQVYATISINARIQPTWTESFHTQGWGTARGGSWPVGKYRAECKYGGKLIGKDWFELVSGGNR